MTGSRTVRKNLLYHFSFESDFEGWIPKATDVSAPPVPWSIQRSNVLARDRLYALELTLDNWTDAGKIWIERPFMVAPNKTYRVNIGFDLASRDCGTMNLWRVIEGARPIQAGSRDDLAMTEETGNQAERDVGFAWTVKQYSVETTSSDEGFIYVQLGIWGTWGTRRQYYLDKVSIVIAETPQQ